MRRIRVMPALIAAALITLAATGTLAACGNSAPSATTALSAAVQAELRQDVQSVAAALAAKQPARAQTALQVMDADVAAAYTAGKISTAKLAEIRAAATALAMDVQRLAAPTITITARPASAVPTPAAPKAKPKPPPPPAPPPHHHGHKDGGGG